jgi:Cu(I)/Ag(I) efflux system membrane fusion protein
MRPGAKSFVLLAAVAVIAGGIGFGIARYGAPMSTETQAVPEQTGRAVLYWYDPMVPTQHFEKPGKSPFMDMQLRPKYADEGGDDAAVRIDPGLAQNLGVRLETVKRGTLEESIDATGVIAFNERDVAIVQARAGGFVERTYRTAPGDIVAEGAPLADLYISEWNGAQTEFLALLATREAELIEAGRQRLRLLGMPPGLIADIERSGRPHPVTTVTTPQGGVVQTLNVRPGMTVAAGMTLAEINGLGTVWLNAAVPEAQGGAVREGMTVSAELAAFPGERFTGRVAAILPQAQEESRTLKVRVELPNQAARLRPGMFATVHLAGSARTALLVPAEAVIRTGRRNLVMVAAANGGYQPAEVEIGREAKGLIEIVRGLNEGERVVASGQFLIDSEASLAGVQVRGQATTTMPAAPAASALLESRGRIEKLSAEAVTLSHEPVPAIGWPAMTMNFRLASPQLAQGLKVGDRVEFGFVQEGAGPVVRSLSKTGGAP